MKQKLLLLMWLITSAIISMPVMADSPSEPPSMRLFIEKDFTISAGEEKEMVIELTNPFYEITMVQFDLYLPQGLSLKKENGRSDPT